MQVEAPFGLTPSFLDWLQSGVQAPAKQRAAIKPINFLSHVLFIHHVFAGGPKFSNHFSEEEEAGHIPCSDLRKPSCEGTGGS